MGLEVDLSWNKLGGNFGRGGPDTWRPAAEALEALLRADKGIEHLDLGSNELAAEACARAEAERTAFVCSVRRMFSGRLDSV